MNVRALVGFLAAALLVLSSLAHAFAGWPPMNAALKAADADAGLVGALSVGWFFGSLSMLAFGLIVLLAAVAAARGRPTDRAPLWVIALAYLGFGLGAFVIRDLNPHFLIFVATGALMAAFAASRDA